MTRSLVSSEIGGEISAPPSKSSMQRAVACALLAGGESRLTRPSYCADSLAALAIAESLGSRVRRGAAEVAILGGFAETAKRAADSESHNALSTSRDRRFSCGESGLCIRMFTPIAALLGGETTLDGSGSLLSRPVSAIEKPLRGLGASCETRGGFPPVTVRGPMLGGSVVVDGRESSQFATGLLIALPLAPRDSTIVVEGMVSGGYIDLTLSTMRAFGVVVVRDASTTDPSATRFLVKGGQSYASRKFEVEGDWSGAAFLLVAGAIAARKTPLVVSHLQEDSTQPDKAVLGLLEAVGAGVERLPGAVRVSRRRLLPFEFDASDCPDLFPPLVALAAHCEGESLIRGAGRLRHKESDRASALAGEFAKLGVRVADEGDALRVFGGSVEGGRVDSRNDHRIAMAVAVASLGAEGAVVVDGCECVSKSWPAFFEDLDSLRAGRA